MNTRHRYLPIDQVTEGMVLAVDLLDKVGHILLPSGTNLTAKMLHSISHHDIQQLSVVVEALSDEEQQRQQEHALERLTHLFRLSGETAPASTLLQYVRAYRLQELP